MKTILVMRHGKSDWQADYGDDYDRPLAERGIRAARQMGRFLQRIEQAPEKVLSSSALRARRTAELAAEAGAWQCDVDYDESVYGASAHHLVDLVRSQRDRISRLLLVGHQPTLSALIAELTGGAHVRFPTAALARIDFATDHWTTIRGGSGQLAWLVTPKLLAEEDRACE